MTVGVTGHVCQFNPLWWYHRWFVRGGEGREAQGTAYTGCMPTVSAHYLLVLSDMFSGPKP
jgi:hypothetical protein